ncbi:MAG: FimV/HubP family polar landmark protein [Burkholderiales bacterium]
MTVSSGLGQPLRAEIEVVSLQPGEADTLAAAVAPPNDFRQANIEYSGALQSIRFAIERRPNNQYVISMTSIQPMNEPFIDMLVELTWSGGRLVREYTFLLDPPELKPTISAPTPAVVPPVVAPLLQEPPKPLTTPAPAASSSPVAAPTSPSSAAPAKPTAKPSGQHQVKRGDTLAKIAMDNMVAGASLQQMLGALYRSNEDAFDGKNMNRLRVGKILNLPASSDIQSLSQDDAIQLVRTQAAQYADYQRSIGAAVVAAPARAEGSRQATGKISAPSAEKPAAKAAAKDQLRLSKPDDAKAAGRGAAAATADDLAAKDKALKEAQERVALLEKNVQDLQKLLQLKSAGGTQAQTQAEAGKAAPKADPTKPAAPAPKVDAPVVAKAEAGKAPTEPGKSTAEPGKSTVQPSAEAPKPAVPGEAPKPGAPEGAKPVAEAPGEAAKPAAEGATAPDVAKAAPKPAPKAPPPPPPPPPSFVDELLDNELAVGGAGGVLVLLAGYAAYAWRRKKKAASADFGDSVESESPISKASIASSAVAADSEPASTPAESSESNPPSGGGEEIDPIAEADVYMAYGRDTQAEEILKEALSKDVNRTPVWVKLLEVYANRKDLPTFESTAMDLQTLTGGQGPDWEKAQALGLQIDPGNALYGGSASPDMASTQVLSPDATLSGDATVIPDAAMIADAEQDVAGQSVDFDLDLGGDSTGDQAAGGVDLDLGAADAAPEGEQAGSGLDFDLGLGGDTPAAEPANDFMSEGALSMDSPAAPVIEMPADSGDAGASIDFDLGMGDTPAETAVVETSPEPTADDGGLTMDFNLNLDDPAPAVESIDPAPSSTDIDLSALSLDLGSDAAPPGDPMDAKWQEVATKLDLAKAYDEMGDKDGARDLLNEVLHEGDAAQKQQAQSMIDALG